MWFRLLAVSVVILLARAAGWGAVLPLDGWVAWPAVVVGPVVREPWWHQWVGIAVGVGIGGAVGVSLLGLRGLGRLGKKAMAGGMKCVNWLVGTERPPVATVAPPEGAGGLSREALTLAYLERNEVKCPVCGYNVHRLTEARCPECGRGLALRLVMVDGISRTWMALVGLTAIGAAPAVMILLVDDEYGHLWQLESSWQFALGFFAASVPLLALVVLARKELMRGRGVFRRVMAVAYLAGLMAAYLVMVTRIG